MDVEDRALLPRRPLRMATFSETKDLSLRPNKKTNAQNTLDRMFFSYLKKLLNKLHSNFLIVFVSSLNTS